MSDAALAPRARSPVDGGSSLAGSRPSATEWPTWALAGVIHGGWIALTMGWTHLPWWLAVPAGAWLVAWHGSLQHETIHGHPSRSRRLNALLGSVPLGLWLPYGVYCETHLRHHAARRLADPTDDPESPYVTPQVWERAGRMKRAGLWLQTTLAGRMVVGPFAVVASEWTAAARRLLGSDRATVRHWSWHALGVAGVLLWLRACHVPIAAYLAGCVYPGIALTLLRSFAEHRVAAAPGHRTAIVEAEAPFALLFLNNNLHAVHHDHPEAPWYVLPRLYRRARETYHQKNGGWCARGYASIVIAHGLRRARDCVAAQRASVAEQSGGPDVVAHEGLQCR